MAVSLDDFTASRMTQAVVQLGNAVESNLLLTGLFKTVNNWDTNIVRFGKLASSVRVSRYRRPAEGAAPVALLTGTIQTAECPKIRNSKSMDEIDSKVLNPALPGYNFAATDPNQNLTENLMLQAEHLRRVAENTIELQCAQGLTTGSVSIPFSDGTIQTVAFGYSTGATSADEIQTALTGDNRWGQATANPRGTLDTLAGYIRRHSTYGGPLKVYMGQDAWNAFSSDSKVTSALDNRHINAGSLTLAEQGAYKGNAFGYDIYTYNYGYENAAGTWVDAFDQETIAMVPVASDWFSIEYGACWDKPFADSVQAQWITTPYFSKMISEGDPPVNKIIVECRPLALIRNPACVRVQNVVAA